MRNFIKTLPLLANVRKRLNNLNERTEWVKKQLELLPPGSLILDAGCGSQQFRKYCQHLNYKAQDFGQYIADEKKMLGAESGGLGSDGGYVYGELDYTGDIWHVPEKDSMFDAILCTEVFEHIPYPNETIAEFNRLLKPGGKLILTAPSNCLRHMDPYFYYSGFSDRWYDRILNKNNFILKEIIAVGDYYSWMSVEIARTAMTHSLFTKILLFPAFLFYYNMKKTEVSVSTLCGGYHVVAIKNKKSISACNSG
jgi:SAM-dependent methyltransferase